MVNKLAIAMNRVGNGVGVWIQIQKGNVKEFFYGDENILYLDRGRDYTNNVME